MQRVALTPEVEWTTPTRPCWGGMGSGHRPTHGISGGKGEIPTGVGTEY
jgi:hypothetical protein